VVARDVDVRVHCGPGVRPLRVLGRPADIVGDTVTAPFAKIYARRQHYFVLEVEVAPAAPGATRRLADVSVTFHDLLRNQQVDRAQVAQVQFTSRLAEVEARANPAILAELGMIDDNAASEDALQMLKRGNTGAARKILTDSAAQLEDTYRTTRDRRLAERVRRSREQIRKVDTLPVLPNILKLREQITGDPLQGLQVN
jgi:Ca-activated chloride channel family protein